MGSGIGGEAMGLPLHKPDGFIFWAKPKFFHGCVHADDCQPKRQIEKLNSIAGGVQGGVSGVSESRCGWKEEGMGWRVCGVTWGECGRCMVC